MAVLEGGRKPRVCVIIPCLNEERTLGPLIRGFRKALPESRVVVVDNGSSDGTAETARREGAVVLFEKRRGKGHAVHKALQSVEGDIGVLVDGDGTYLPEDALKLLEPVASGKADMTVGSRLDRANTGAIHWFNLLGNYLITRVLNLSFGSSFRDVLSGYRVFDLQALKNLPLISPGFEIEVEMAVQALHRGLVVQEVPIAYLPRPDGSRSKLRPVQDGYRIVLTIAVLMRDLRPLFITVSSSCLLLCLGAACGVGLALGQKQLFGFLIFSGSVFLSLILVSTGLILNAVNSRFSQLRDMLLIRGGTHEFRDRDERS